MRTRVTAILVAQSGGEWLDETIAGIAALTSAPDRIIAVNNGGSDAVGVQLMSSGAERVVGLPHRVPFGRAVQEAVREAGFGSADPAAAAATTAGAGNAANAASANTASEDTDSETTDWLWLLTEDSCPEPEALEHILNRVERAPSVVVAGPKLVDWDRPERITELGQSLTRYGSRWLLRRQELDQEQYDHMQDVMAVGPVGMLVRHDIWEQLGGFDAALPVYDDGLDFSVRARLAGYRVEVAPASRVRFAQSGVAGPHIDRKRSVMRQAHRQARTSQLHRHVAYPPAIFAFFAWLLQPVYGVLRVLWALIREQPGNMLGELAASFSVFFTPHKIIASRKRIRKQSTVGWSAIRPLRVDPKSVRTARMIDREAILASTGQQRSELHFISSGGLAVLVTATVISIALTWWAFAHTSIVGGGLAPLSPLNELWWNTRAIDGVPADPFTWVLALLGTITFWNPSQIIVVLLIVAIPVTALGGWIWGAQLTRSPAGRALLGLGFAVSPVLLGSLAGGHLPTLVLTMVLPWLLLAATRCRESWSWAGTASLLAAVALASAPVLIPMAIVLLVVGVFTTLRGIARVLTTAIVPVVLFAPNAITYIVEGRPLDLLLDPGITAPFTAGTPWHLAIGFPEFGLEGWAAILDTFGLGGPPATLLVGVLVLPLALLALLGLYTGRIAVTVLNALLGGLGLATAIAAGQLRLTVSGDENIALWTGSGLAVYWIALLGLATVGAAVLRRAAPPVVAVALVAALVAVAPLGWKLVTDDVPFSGGNTQMPALVQAAGETHPGVRALVISAEGPHVVSGEFVTGAGVRLDEVRSVEQTPTETDQDRQIATLIAGLASVGGEPMDEALRNADVGFVLLTDGGDTAERAQLQLVFDQHASLTSAGQTAQGLLWRVTDSDVESVVEGDVTTEVSGTSLTGSTIWWIQLIVLLGVMLLALPTGEVTWRPEKRKKTSRRARNRAAKQKLKDQKAEQAAVVKAEADQQAAQDQQTVPAESEPAESELAEPELAHAAPTEPAAHDAAETGTADPAPEEPAAAEPAAEPAPEHPTTATDEEPTR